MVSGNGNANDSAFAGWLPRFIWQLWSALRFAFVASRHGDSRSKPVVLLFVGVFLSRLVFGDTGEYYCEYRAFVTMMQ